MATMLLCHIVIAKIIQIWKSISALGKMKIQDRLFLTRIRQNGSSKEGWQDKKGQSTINEVVTREYMINIHKHGHGVGFKKCAPWALKRNPGICHEGVGNCGCAHRHQSQQSPLGQRNKECPTRDPCVVV